MVKFGTAIPHAPKGMNDANNPKKTITSGGTPRHITDGVHVNYGYAVVSPKGECPHAVSVVNKEKGY